MGWGIRPESWCEEGQHVFAQVHRLFLHFLIQSTIRNIALITPEKSAMMNVQTNYGNCLKCHKWSSKSLRSATTNLTNVWFCVQITTVEYQKITISGTDKVTYVHPMELAQRWWEWVWTYLSWKFKFRFRLSSSMFLNSRYVENFDFAISFSSIEHSGLGRCVFFK